MGGGLDPCLGALKEAKRRLKEGDGVTSLLDEEERRLVIPVLGGGLDLIYNAVCIDDSRIKVVSVVRGVWRVLSKFSDETKLEILRKLLLIPANLKVAISIDHEGDLLFELWASSMSEANWKEVHDSFMLSIIFTKWLTDQLRNAEEGKPIEEFRLKKMK